MPNQKARQMFSQELHISHNQIFNYLTCSLKYKLQYVEGRPPERISIALFFGSAIHAAIEMYYRSLKNKGQIEPLAALQNRFQTCMELDFKTSSVPIIFKKDTPNPESAIKMGKKMLAAFYENIAQTAQTAKDIVGVELPLSARLYTETGQPTDFKLAGILDLVLRDKNGEILVVDNKTAAKPISKSSADDSGQLTAYAYLLASNKYVFPTAPVKCRFDVLRKLKTPNVEQVSTIRNAKQRKQFAKVANAVLSAIDAGIHMPQPSWMCGDCAYSNACRSW